MREAIASCLAKIRFADFRTRIDRMIADNEDGLFWLQARHSGREVCMRVRMGVHDPVQVVWVEVRLDDLPPDLVASVDAIRAMRALGWPLSKQRTVYWEPPTPEELSAHQRMEMIRRVEEALAR